MGFEPVLQGVGFAIREQVVRRRSGSTRIVP
jgi:hypothetical protein